MYIFIYIYIYVYVYISNPFRWHQHQSLATHQLIRFSMIKQSTFNFWGQLMMTGDKLSWLPTWSNILIGHTLWACMEEVTFISTQHCVFLYKNRNGEFMFFLRADANCSVWWMSNAQKRQSSNSTRVFTIQCRVCRLSSSFYRISYALVVSLTRVVQSPVELERNTHCNTN